MAYGKLLADYVKNQFKISVLFDNFSDVLDILGLLPIFVSLAR